MTELTRRRLIVGAAAAIAAVACARPRGSERAAQGTTRPRGATRSATPSCGEGSTVEQTEGPFFTPDSPERTNIREGVEGTPLTIAGAVMTTNCEPVRRALIDVWQADDEGNYDNEGYRLRGHFFTGDDGRYRFETIYPARYTGRTRHIHVKVQAPNGPVLTTQLYFPGEPGNESDAIFDPALVVDMKDEGTAEFDFVVRT